MKYQRKLMLILNDKNIRESFIKRLERFPTPPRGIIEELPVHKGNAIADIVAIHSEAHCYEIKGETDKVTRILEQSRYYNKTFRKITLITTKNHINNALRITPDFWGIIIATNKNGKIIFQHLRKASLNKFIDKKMSLDTLWKAELTTLANSIPCTTKKNATRDELISSIEEVLNSKGISTSISHLLEKRYKAKR